MQGIKIELGLRCSATHLEELSGNEVWGGMELNWNELSLKFNPGVHCIG